MTLRLADCDKAAFLAGMVHAFEAVGWPAHFSEDDIETWRQRRQWAMQGLSGGYFNPAHGWEVAALVDEELSGEI